MVLTAASFHAIPFTDTDPHSSPSQVSIAKSSFLFEIKAVRRKFLAPGAESSSLFKPTGSLVVRIQSLTQSSGEPLGERNSSRIPIADKGFKDLRWTALQPPQVHPAGNHPRHDLQRLRGSSALQTDIQLNKVVGSEERKHHLFLDPPAHLQRDIHTGGLGSSSLERNLPSTSSVVTGKKAQPPKRRGGRNSSRGFDVLDELMSAQGRSSRALLESLQSEVAFEKDEMVNVGIESVGDAQASPFLNRKFPARSDLGRKLGGVSRMIADSPRVERLHPIYGGTTDTASMSSPFASSIGKALSPPVDAKSIHVTNIGTRNASAGQQSVQSSISDVAQPTLRGQEVLLALQKAANERAKQRQKNRKPNDRAIRGKEIVSRHDSGEWQNAKPIVLRPEWAFQIDDLERRIEILKNPLSSS